MHNLIGVNAPHSCEAKVPFRARRVFGCWPRCERLGGVRPRMTGERIREVKEEAGRQTGRGTGADSLTRRPRPARHKTTGRDAPFADSDVLRD